MCLSLGMSTPRIRGIRTISEGSIPLGSRLAGDGEPASAGQPCRCLWRGFVQITYTLPARRTILQFSQIRFTLDRTFMVFVNHIE